MTSITYMLLKYTQTWKSILRFTKQNYLCQKGHFLSQHMSILN